MKLKYLPLICLLSFFCVPVHAQAAHSVTAKWTAPTSGGSVTGYNVKRSTVSGGPYTTVGTVTAPTLQFIDTANLVEGTKYFYIVTATGPGGEGQPSSEANALIPFSVPGTPGGFTVTPQ